MGRQIGSFLNELRHDAHCDLHDAAGLDANSYRTRDALQLLAGRKMFIPKMVKNGSRLASAPNHTQKEKWLLDPMTQHERIVPVAPRHY